MRPNADGQGFNLEQVSVLDLIEYFNERAGVYEFEAHTKREEAEKKAELDANSQYVVFQKITSATPNRLG